MKNISEKACISYIRYIPLIHQTETNMTTQQVIDLAKRINEIDGRVSAYAEGGMVLGTFRGKRNEDYKYNVSARAFVYNNEGPSVQAAVEQAVKDILK